MDNKVKLTDIKDSNLFCPLPWVGAHIMPNGTFSYCCVQNQFDEELIEHGNLATQTIDEARNNEWSNDLRKDLLDGVQNKSCQSCWKLENQGIPSLRQHYHEQWFKDKGYADVFEVYPDGTLDNQKIIYWDVRQTNICNMKCLSCGPEYSSMWNVDIQKSHGAQHTKNGVIDAVKVSKDNIFEVVKSSIEHGIHKFYFAGGEPLISPMHWAILDELVSQKQFQVELAYNTNLSKLTYMNKDVIKYWKQFDNVYIGCSIDAIGDRAEVVRTGSIWNNIDNNFRKLQHALPKEVALNVTTSNLSIGGLVDTIAWATQFDWVDQKNQLLLNNLVYNPTYLSINVLPVDLKEKIWKNLKEPLNTLDNKRGKEQLESELWRDTDKDEFEYLSFRFAQHIHWVNSMRNSDPYQMLSKGCPELLDWFVLLNNRYKKEFEEYNS
jgi:uncharacterized Fe-S cluster-containing radical SAM superfamily protein